MSSCISYFQNGKILVCADSRVSTKINGKHHYVTDKYRKIRKYGDKVIFLSGSSSLVELMFKLIEANMSISEINDIYNTVYDNRINNELELIIDIFTIENNIAVIYHGSSINKEFERYIQSNKALYTSGAKGAEIFEHIKKTTEQYEKDNKIVYIEKLILETFEKFACEFIGGIMHCFMISQDGIQAGEVKIKEDKTYPNWVGEPFPYHCDANGNLTASNANLSGSLNMTSGSINWGNVSKPSYSASDVGALSSSSPKLTYIDQNGIYTGQLTANQITAGKINAQYIDTDSLRVNKLYNTTNPNHYAVVGGNFGDMTLYGNNQAFFQVYNNLNGVSLKSFGSAFLTADSYGNAHFHGNVTGVTAKFG